MTALVERVARAIARERDGFFFPDNPERLARVCVGEARAAIAVIREALHDIPPEAIRAMAIAVSEGARPMPDAARALADVMFKESDNG